MIFWLCSYNVVILFPVLQDLRPIIAKILIVMSKKQIINSKLMDSEISLKDFIKRMEIEKQALLKLLHFIEKDAQDKKPNTNAD